MIDKPIGSGTDSAGHRFIMPPSSRLSLGRLSGPNWKRKSSCDLCGECQIIKFGSNERVKTEIKRPKVKINLATEIESSSQATVSSILQRNWRPVFFIRSHALIDSEPSILKTLQMAFNNYKRLKAPVIDGRYLAGRGFDVHIPIWYYRSQTTVQRCSPL